MSVHVNPFCFGHEVCGDNFCDKKQNKYYLIDSFMKYRPEKLG